MNQALQDMQASSGAVWAQMNGQSVVASFGNDAAAIATSSQGVALHDCSHWGRIEVSDGDRLRFLHNQSTNDFMSLKPGQGCDTVFVTSTARTIDLVTAYILDDAVLLLTFPACRERLLKWMDQFIFFADKVKLKDVTETTATFSLIGPESQALLTRLGIELPGDWPQSHHQTVELNGIPVRVAAGSELSGPGYTLIASAEEAAQLWRSLTEAGAVPLGEQAWERLRIEQGRPVPGRELTEDYNPLEAGLWHTISFSKGCYIGQETIARLDTYKGVKQQLWGIRLDTLAEPGSPITVEDGKAGVLTSVTTTEDGVIGLAYIRTKSGGVGTTVKVQTADGETVQGEVMDVPFLTRDRTT